MKDKKGFTLAEVLITLAIIGVIAAITIPSIVANHQKRTLETQFAKAYRTLQQVINLAIAENGDMGTWNWKDSMTIQEQDAFIGKYFLPHLNVVKYCSSENTTRGCFPNVVYKYLNGEDYISYSNPAGGSQIVLADGSLIRFYFVENCLEEGNRCLTYNVDVNGHKKPNMIGRDVFAFSFYPQTSELLPHGTNKNKSFDVEKGAYEKIDAENARVACNNSNETENTGWYCARIVLEDGFKMNY